MIGLMWLHGSGALPVPLWQTAITLPLALGISSWVTLGILDRVCWKLTDTELIGGFFGRIHLPLASIGKVFVGLPPPGGATRLLFGGTPALDMIAAAKADSLLIKFKDGRILPLYLVSMPDGPFLMSELVNRLHGRVTKDHHYNDREIKRLRMKAANVLYKAANL